MKRLALAFTLIASTAHAGGLNEPHVAPNPCPPGVITDGTLTGDMLAGFMAIREMTCGERPVRAFFDRHTGERLTDEEILRRVFNGHSPAVIPLPAAVWALLAALGALAMVGRRK